LVAARLPQIGTGTTSSVMRWRLDNRIITQQRFVAVVTQRLPARY
jgi:hypothetical protein